MQTKFKLHGFGLAYDGLTASYECDGDFHTLDLSPSEVCKLFKDSGLIEDFTDCEKTAEPIILYTDKTNPQGYSGQYWGDFLRSFDFSREICQALLQYEEDRNAHHCFQQQINHLLSPLESCPF